MCVQQMSRESPRSKQTNQPLQIQTSAASVEGLTSPAFPGSTGSTQPFQEIWPQATGHTGKLTLGPQLGHISNFCPPERRTARGMFPQPTCPWLTVFPPNHVMRPIPFSFVTQPQNSFLPTEPPHCRLAGSP